MTMKSTILALTLLATVPSVVLSNGGRAFVFQLTLEVQNNGDECVSPMWYGIHTGNFDPFDGRAQSNRLLGAIANNGNYGPLMGAFADTPNSLVDGIVESRDNNGRDICPGDSVSKNFVVKVGGPRRKTKFYFSHISALNGEVFGNGNPTANLIFRPIYQENLFPFGAGNNIRLDLTAVKTKNRARAKLNGRNFPVEVDSPRGGAVTFSIDNDRQSFAISYRVKITRAFDTVTKAALVVLGNELFDFMEDAPDANRKGVLDIKGEFEEGSLAISNEELWNEIFNGNAVVIVFSEEFPDGDLLGQLRIAREDD